MLTENILFTYIVPNYDKQLKQLKARILLNGNLMTELRDATCCVGSHSVICYPTQVNAPRPNPSRQVGTRFTNPEEWKAELTYGNGTAGSRTGDLSISSPTP